MEPDAKRQIYATIHRQITGVLEGVEDPITTFATVASVLHQALPYSSWTGFYRVVAPGLLRVGPYQGPVACLEIPFERGVCGAAARQRATQVVGDVEQVPDHIACDAAARSEIVVPIEDATGELVAVLDIDSHELDSFDEVDREELEKVSAGLVQHLGTALAEG